MQVAKTKTKYLRALKAAFPHTIPIFAGFWFLGLTYGIYTNASGFSFWYPMLMSLTIFAGSVEFVAVNFRLSKAETFSVKICVGRIDDEGGETFVNEITEQVVRVVSGGFQSYFYIGHIVGNGLNPGKKPIKALPVILNGKNLKEDFTI